MVGRHSDLWGERVFFWFKILLVLAIIIVFGYFFCKARPCY
ncbi:MAG: hypothetical protein ACYTEL_05150 [Planctomycetota bacterium]|jgi:hypothetical protein